MNMCTHKACVHRYYIHTCSYNSYLWVYIYIKVYIHIVFKTICVYASCVHVYIHLCIHHRATWRPWLCQPRDFQPATFQLMMCRSAQRDIALHRRPCCGESQRLRVWLHGIDFGFEGVAIYHNIGVLRCRNMFFQWLYAHGATSMLELQITLHTREQILGRWLLWLLSRRRPLQLGAYLHWPHLYSPIVGTLPICQ